MPHLNRQSSNEEEKSLDWDSPSTLTGTVKRRPISGDSLLEADDTLDKFPSDSKAEKEIYYTSAWMKGESGKVKNNRRSKLPTIIPRSKNPYKNSTQEGNSSLSLGEAESHRYQRVLRFTDCHLQTKLKVLRGNQWQEDQYLREDQIRLEDSTLQEVKESSSRSGLSGYVDPQKTGVSDSDSGIASPLSPSSLCGFLGYVDKDKEYSREYCKEQGEEDTRAAEDVNLRLFKSYQIYTDWANHYLEKARSKKRVNSLASDCSDGVLLAEVIESVMCQKIPDINRKPKTPAQMLDNINLCLNLLKVQHVSGLESVSAQELRDGKLKAILALFFALSRHKQAAKQRAQQAQQQQLADMTPNRAVLKIRRP